MALSIFFVDHHIHLLVRPFMAPWSYTPSSQLNGEVSGLSVIIATCERQEKSLLQTPVFLFAHSSGLQVALVERN